jgi:prepilin-type N-terminal cleavage/methylation domain-containing protein
MRGDRGRVAGFTLIEVLVALAIVGLALAAVAGVFSNGLIGHETAAGAEDALALAEERLAIAATPGTLRPGTSKGVFAERFAWETTVALYDEGSGPKPFDQNTVGQNTMGQNPSGQPPMGQPEDQPRLYRIAVSVAWRDGHRSRQLALATLRLGIAAP